MEKNLEIVYLPIKSLKPYKNNTRKHEKKDVDAIAKSIERFGMNDAIGIWGKDNTIVEGHGRWLACKQLGMDKVPCVRLDHLTDKERREYAIAHNATAEMSSWFDDMLDIELPDLDLDDFGFSFGKDEEEPVEDEEEKENPYTMNINAPVYEIKGDCPSLSELVETAKVEELLANIKKADVPEEIKTFLTYAAMRHLKFDYGKIAEYYAHASKEVQELFEDSALVIIDFDAAIKNGFTKLSSRIKEMRDGEE